MGKYSCETCKKKCKKEAIRLQDKFFHISCFKCKECNRSLATDGFYTRDGAYYCASDYQRIFGTKCHACGMVVEGETMTILGKSYHQDCFQCSKCCKKFLSGEKVTFAANGEHWCRSCQHQHEQQKQLGEKAAASAASVAADSHPAPSDTAVAKPESAVAVEIPTSPSSPDRSDFENNRKTESPPLEEVNTVQQTSKETNEVNGSKVQKPATNLPRVFGMPNNKFYNISYLERLNADFKRGCSVNAMSKEPSVTHYHRPVSDNFSYTNLRRDFKSELGVQGKKELVLMSKRPDAQVKPLAPIEKDDWPGPPEPAAAYPELLRDKIQKPKSPAAGEIKPEDEKVSKEIDELTKMTDSGAAAVILRDLKKKRSESPTLDPRFAAMTPSAALEPQRKPRYELPFFASPSRNLDMRQHVLDQEKNRKSMNDSLIAPNNFGGVVKSGYGLSVLRPGSSFDARNGYQSDGFEVEARPKSSAGILQSNTLDVYNDRSCGEIDPTTGLRHSSHLKSLTLPQAVSGRYFLDSINLASPGSKELELPKIFSYEVLIQKNFENLVGVNKDALECHLSKDEFEQIFNMSQVEFYRLPVWQRTEAKLKVGLM